MTTWRHKASPTAGILWMLASCAILSGVASLGRYASLEGVPTFQIVFLRLLFALVALIPLAIARGPDIIRTDHPRLYAIRIMTGLCAMASWFGALSLIPVGEVTAITFLTPLFATLGAVLAFGEKITPQRMLGLVIGFAGAMIILRPGLIAVGMGTWVALLAAAAMAASTLFIKRLTNTDDPDKVVFISTLCQTPIALIPALLVWVWPPVHMWGVFALMGLLATMGHVALSRAFASADVGLVMGVDFSRLPFAVLFGYLLFSELIDAWTWVGAAVIFAGTVIATRRRQTTVAPARR